MGPEWGVQPSFWPIGVVVSARSTPTATPTPSMTGPTLCGGTIVAQSADCSTPTVESPRARRRVRQPLRGAAPRDASLMVSPFARGEDGAGRSDVLAAGRGRPGAVAGEVGGAAAIGEDHAVGIGEVARAGRRAGERHRLSAQDAGA